MPDLTTPIRPLAAMVLTLAIGGCQAQQMRAAAAARAAGTLAVAAPMAQGRAAHTATSLGNGRVLVAGGFTGQEATIAGAELYDPSSRRFTLTARMATPRQSHTATALADGKVLLAGGYDARGTALASAEIFDPSAGTFAATGTMRSARAGQVAVRLADGRVLLAGGVGPGWTFLASAELYDPSTGTFAATGSMGVPRESHAAARLADGGVLVAGGHRGRRTDVELYTSLEIYDPSVGAFAPAGEMTVRRHKHDAILLADGRVLISGGTDEQDFAGRYPSAEIFDPRTGRARRIADMRVPRYKHQGTSVRLPDGRVLLAGGADRAEIFDPGTESFQLVEGEARMAGQFCATAPLANGGVLITGGYGEHQGPQAAAWLYGP